MGPDPGMLCLTLLGEGLHCRLPTATEATED